VYPYSAYSYSTPFYGAGSWDYTQQAPATGYWYYCRSANAYYPTVATCPEGWITVPPRSP
jgi:hypothetical protein